MAEIYPHIITEVEINNTVVPYTSEDAIFNGSLNEVLLLDVKPKFGEEVYNDLITNGVEETSGETWSGFSEYTQSLLDNGLKLAIAYYVVARTMRKPSTCTRFGITDKTNSMESVNTSNSSLVSQSGYYKSVADGIVTRLLQEFKPARETTNSGFGVKIIGR